jgi:RNA polymerase sigma-70 factor (ECF subfamily)
MVLLFVSGIQADDSAGFFEYYAAARFLDGFHSAWRARRRVEAGVTFFLVLCRPKMTDERVDQENIEILRRIALKDAAALETFYDRYNRLVFSLVLRILRVREDAEDIVVDVFWQVWQQAGRYDSSRGKPVAWLLTIARTRAIDGLRSSNRQAARPSATGGSEDHRPLSTAESVPDPGILADTRQAVRKALTTLPDQQRIPLEMAYFEGMTHTEIAESLNEPLGTMKDRIRTGMLHLKKQLKAYL